MNKRKLTFEEQIADLKKKMLNLKFGMKRMQRNSYSIITTISN